MSHYPNIALQDYISWEEIDNTHAKVIISYYRVSASGTFTSDGNGTMMPFTTNGRVAAYMKRNIRSVPRAAMLSDYRERNRKN